MGKAEVRERDRKKLAVRMEEGALSSQLQAPLEAGKAGTRLPLAAPGRNRRSPHLDFGFLASRTV